MRSTWAIAGLCAIIVGGVIASRMLYEPLTAALRDVVATETPTPAPIETDSVFPQSREIQWSGTVFGVLGGGNGFAVRRENNGGMFQAYFADGRTSSISYEPVRIHGYWTGISCAYRQTLFEGKCTPTVDILTIEILPAELR